MYLMVKVTPDAKKEALKELGPNRFEVKVKAPAARGLANAAALNLLAAHLKLPRSHLRIISGHHERSKLIRVRD